MERATLAGRPASVVEGVPLGAVTLYRLSGLAVLIGMTIEGIASVL